MLKIIQQMYKAPNLAKSPNQALQKKVSLKAKADQALLFITSLSKRPNRKGTRITRPQ